MTKETRLKLGKANPDKYPEYHKEYLESIKEEPKPVNSKKSKGEK